MNKNLVKKMKKAVSDIIRGEDFDANDEQLENFTMHFYQIFSKKDVYNYLINTYIKSKELAELDLFDKVTEKFDEQDPIKWHGDVDDNWKERINSKEYESYYPKLWKFRTDTSKIFKEFENDLIFFENLGLFTFKVVKKGVSSKKEYGAKHYEADMKGSKTKKSISIIIKDSSNEDDVEL